MNDRTEWFNAVLLVEALHPDEPEYDERLIERRVVLLRADSEAEAVRKAADICTGLREDYVNVDEMQVHWRCTSVATVNPLHITSIDDGAEVYSEYLPSSAPTTPVPGPGP